MLSICQCKPHSTLAATFYHARQHSTARRGRLDQVRLPCIQIRKPDASEPYHRMWPQKLHHEIHKTVNLLTSASFIGLQSRPAGGAERSKGEREKKKERSVITRCAASVRSVTAPLFILNTELFPPRLIEQESDSEGG